MTEHKFPFTIDPATGLPQLPENYVFNVSSGIIGGGFYVEIDGVRDEPVYMVEIVELEEQKFKPEEPVYVSGFLGFKKFSHMTERQPLPREINRYGMRGFGAFLAEGFTFETLPEDLSDVVKQRVHTSEEWKKNQRPSNSEPIPYEYYRRLELNDENILNAAIESFQKWSQWKADQESKRLKREARKDIEDKYCGMYPPRGINHERTE